MTIAASSQQHKSSHWPGVSRIEKKLIRLAKDSPIRTFVKVPGDLKLERKRNKNGKQ